MLNFNKTLVMWYRNDNKFKRFVSRFVSYPYNLLFVSFKINIIDAFKRPGEMKRLGLIKHPILVCFDMLFWYVFFGYFPSTYASYQFYNVPLNRRLTFISTLEKCLFARALNIDGDINILRNKNRAYEYLKEFYGREQIIIRTEEDFKKFNDFVFKKKKFFYKPLGGTCGRGAGLANSETIDIKNFFSTLIRTGPYVVEDLIQQCKNLSSLHPSSVNTIRVVTFKAKTGTEILFGGLRCGQGGNVVDNGGSGGIFIPFDIKTGCLYKIGFDENGRRFEKHPDTNIIFDHFQIPRYEDVKSLAIRAAEKLPGFRYIGWDIAVTNEKVILVEGNHSPVILILEALHKTGFKKELRELANTGIISDNFRKKQKEIF